MKRKLISTALVILLCLSLMPTWALATEGETPPAPECVCNGLSRCTTDAVNTDCPVCSAEGADFDTACLGTAVQPTNTLSDTPGATPAPTPTPDATPTTTPEVTPAPTATPEVTPAPTETPEVTPTPTEMPAPTDVPSDTPDDTNTPGADEGEAKCSCTAPCTDDNINPDCPVCGAENADLSACTGKVTDENDNETKLVTSWTWDDEEYITDGAIGLPGLNEETEGWGWDMLLDILPKTVTAIVDGAEETLSLSWMSADFIADENGAYPYEGDFTLTAALPEGYVLADSVPALTLSLELGGGSLLADENTGSFIVEGGKYGEDYTYDTGSSTSILTILTDTKLKISSTAPITNEQIIITDGVAANLTIENLSITMTQSRSQKTGSAIALEGSAECYLTIMGTNFLQGSWNYAGLQVQKSGTDGKTGKLTITADSTGSLEAVGGAYGSGIGSSYQFGKWGSGGIITINGGRIKATGGTNPSTGGSAGIGGAEGDGGGVITINGGYVEAIGHGNSDEAKSGDPAGIGGGDNGAGGIITINGGTVIATTRKNGGSGIGSGADAEDGNSVIKITGGTVRATGGLRGSGIGTASGTNRENAGTVIITGGDVTACSIGNGSAIGKGMYTNNGKVTISGGIVKAYTDYHSIRGEFSTGEKGDAIIFAARNAPNTGTSDIAYYFSDTSTMDSWNAMIFCKTEGKLYGEITPTEDFEIPEGYTLSIPKDQKLYLKNGVTMNNHGTVTVGEDGDRSKDGLLDYTDGAINNYGSISGYLIIPNTPATWNDKQSEVKLAVSANPAAYKETITLTAAVQEAATNGLMTMSIPQRTMYFYRDDELLGSCEVVGNTATLQVELDGEEWAPGAYTLKAVYTGGNDQLLPAESAPLNLSVTKTTHAPLYKTVLIKNGQVNSGVISLADVFGTEPIPEGVSLGAPQHTGSNNYLSTVEVNKIDNTISYSSNTNAEGSTGEDIYTVSITSTYYQDFTLTLRFKATDKSLETITGVTGIGSEDYNGQPRPGYTGTPTSAYTGDYVITYTGRNNTVYNSPNAPTDAGDYTVTIAIPDNAPDHTGAITLNFSIATAENSWTTEPGIEGWTYGAPENPVGAARFGTPAFTYYTKQENNYIPLQSKPTNVGSYWMKATVAADGNNYPELATDYIPFEIAKRPLTPSVKLDANSKVYDTTTAVTGASITLSGAVSGESPTAAAAKYEYDSADVATASKISAAGIALTNGWDTNYVLSADTAEVDATITKAAQTAPAAGEGCGIDCINEKISITADYELSTAETGGSPVANGATVTPGTTLYIRKAEKANYAASPWTAVTIDDRPAKPTGVTTTPESILGIADGSISGITADMEYKLPNGDWTDGKGEALTGLAGNTAVKVRLKATATTFRSEELELTIAAGKGFSISFDSQGGSAVTEITDIPYNTAVAAPAAPQKNGYEFGGWYTDIADPATLYDFSTPVTGDLALSAKWTVEQYKIDYVLNGGTNPTGAPAEYTVESADISLPVPTKLASSFGGWYTEAAFTNRLTEIAAGSVGDLTLYAKWEQVQYTITQGANQTVYKGNGALFAANGDYAKLVGVQVDGVAVDPAYYTVGANPTRVMLTPGFVNLLSVGRHTLTLLFDDGYASADFRVWSAWLAPITGDDANPALYAGLLLVSLAGLSACGVTLKKRRNKGER